MGIAENCWKQLKWLVMSGNDYNLLEWLKNAENGWNGKKIPVNKMAGNNWNGLKG